MNKNINIESLENLIWKIASNMWKHQAITYIKEKNNVSYDSTYDLSSNVNYLDRIIYKEIINNLDNVGLTEKETISFKLYYVKDLSVNEIAQNLNTSISNVKYYLYSARRKIKERYNG